MCEELVFDFNNSIIYFIVSLKGRLLYSFNQMTAFTKSTKDKLKWIFVTMFEIKHLPSTDSVIHGLFSNILNF